MRDSHTGFLDQLEADETVELGAIGCQSDDLIRYAGASGDFNPLHWDPGHARRSGFANVIVHGMLSMGVVARLLQNCVERPTDLVSLRVRFRSELMVGETATVSAWLISRESEGMRTKVAFRAELLREGEAMRPIDLGEATFERARRGGASY